MAITTKCQISGLNFEITDSAKSFASPEFSRLFPKQWLHPIFSISPTASTNMLKALAETPARFSASETYLIGLVAIANTGLVTFEAPMGVSTRTIDGTTTTPSSVTTKNLGGLVKAVTYINCLPATIKAKIPHFNISQDMQYVDFLPTFLETVFEFEIDVLTNNERQRRAKAEELASLGLRKSIERFGNDSLQMAQKLADWACTSACFPTFTLPKNPLAPSSKVLVTCADYWKELICRCVNDEKIFAVDSKDLMELILHCEQFLEHKDYLFHKLMELLRKGAERADNYLGFGDVDLKAATKSFAIVPEETNQETSVLISMILQAPETEPVADNYPTRIAYLQAKNRWNTKAEFLASGQTLESLKLKATNAALGSINAEDL